MKLGQLVAGVAVCVLAASAPAFADVQVTMQNGRVTVVAKDATLRQILTEWARVGQTKVVNVERVPGAPMTLELRDVPEAQALEILLRPLSGYMAAPRAADVANLSRFDRIVVMPTVAAARQAATAAPPPPAAPVFQPQQVMPPQPVDPNDDDDRQQQQHQQQQQPQNRPVFNAFPQPVVNPNGANGQQASDAPPAAAPAPFPTPAPGVSVPGMVVPAPQQQPGLNPQQPLRRPGGSID